MLTSTIRYRAMLFFNSRVMEASTTNYLNFFRLLNGENYLFCISKIYFKIYFVHNSKSTTSKCIYDLLTNYSTVTYSTFVLTVQQRKGRKS